MLPCLVHAVRWGSNQTQGLCMLGMAQSLTPKEYHLNNSILSVIDILIFKNGIDKRIVSLLGNTHEGI